jgi:ferredoxin
MIPIGSEAMISIGNNVWTGPVFSLNLKARRNIMAYVITEPCIGVKDKGCVEVCPMDCIHGAEEDVQMFINPAECVDCGACETECPVGAIYEEREVPAKWVHFIALNAAHFDA